MQGHQNDGQDILIGVTAPDENDAFNTSSLVKPYDTDAEPLNIDTAALKTLADELREIDAQKELQEREQSAPITPVELPVGDETAFKSAFEPSSTFVRDDHNEAMDEPVMPPRVSVWKRWQSMVNGDKLAAGDKTAGEAAELIGKTLPFMRIRILLLFFPILPLVYITVAQARPLPLADSLIILLRPYFAFGVIAALHIIAMLLCYDILAEGIRQLLALQPGRSYALTVANFASLAYIFNVMLLPDNYNTFIPLSAVAAVSLMIALWARYWDAASCFRSLKMAAAIEDPTVIYRKEAGFDKHGVFGRSNGYSDGFVPQFAVRDLTGVLDAVLVPILSVAALLFAFLACFNNGHMEQFIWWYSVLTLTVAPFSIGVGFALPYQFVVPHLLRFKACIARWAAVGTFANDGVAVLGDDDLFPPGRVKIVGLIPFNDASPKRTIVQTASVLRASGCNLALLTDDLLKEMNMRDAVRPVTHFEFYEEGGYSAELNDDRVLVGSGSFMRRMGVSLPKKLPSKTAIFTAVNMSLACIFPLEYTAVKNVRRSVHKLLRNHVPPVCACRDFNVTPALMDEVLTDAGHYVEIPSIEHRLALSSPEHPMNVKPAALMAQNDLVTYTECIVASIRLKTATKVNTIFHLLCSVGGLLLFFFLAFIGSPQTLLPHIVLIFFGVFLIPIWIISAAVNWH
jgi:hypothetical protein